MGTTYQGEELMEEEDVMETGLKCRSPRSTTTTTTTTTMGGAYITTTESQVTYNYDHKEALVVAAAEEQEEEGEGKQGSSVDSERSIYLDNNDGTKSQTHAIPQMNFGNGDSVTHETKLGPKSVEDVADDPWEIQRTLNEQDTHDLICPNCSSCITKRVILRRKRKRPPQSSYIPYNPKRELVEVEPEPEPEHALPPSEPPSDGTPTSVGIHPPPNDTLPPPTTNPTPEEPNVFRCLSCFIFFIPAVSNIKSMRFFGERRKPRDVQNLQPPIKNGEEDNLTPVVEEEQRDVNFPQNGQNVVSQPPPTDIVIGITTENDGLEQVNEAQSRKLDILKSIVYGGLAESIASLGLVSSAAGGDATTMNIIALALASIVGGFFVMAHNLADMKNEKYGGSRNQNGDIDRYWELLGSKTHFKLHATIVILSYIIFGLVAPVTYGFSFRESDNKEYKLLVVAAVSLVCIILLAIAKAYVRRPPKGYINTILSYVVIGVMSSGVSYVVGTFVNKFLEEHGWFEPVPSTTPAFLKPMTVASSWSSS